jgi:hypothetical protein
MTPYGGAGISWDEEDTSTKVSFGATTLTLRDIYPNGIALIENNDIESFSYDIMCFLAQKCSAEVAQWYQLVLPGLT